MTEIDVETFKQIVARTVTEGLGAKGYVRLGWEEEHKLSDGREVIYARKLEPAVRCEVYFQFLYHYILPVQGFKVHLVRRHLSDSQGKQHGVHALQLTSISC